MRVTCRRPAYLNTKSYNFAAGTQGCGEATYNQRSTRKTRAFVFGRFSLLPRIYCILVSSQTSIEFWLVASRRMKQSANIVTRLRLFTSFQCLDTAYFLEFAELNFFLEEQKQVLLSESIFSERFPGYK